MKAYKNLITVLIFCILAILFLFRFNEGFEVILNNKNEIKNIFDFRDLFNFIEYFMINDLDPNIKYPNQYRRLTGECSFGSESLRIRNEIKNILGMLHFLITTNKRDNFYHRFLVLRVGANLQGSMKEKRRINFEEIVWNKIGRQIEYSIDKNKHFLTPKLQSQYQAPLPHNTSVYDYYNNQQMEVNLLALQMLFEILESNDDSLFRFLIRPGEYFIFRDEFLIPLKSIRNSILKIITTTIYKEYILKMLIKNI